ncbi:MAG: DsrE family protein, partial [Fuerstiella sp.]|nr:DsrE family protein [Fuerstiella sp.]
MNTPWKALRALSLTGIAVGLAMAQSGSAGRLPKELNSTDDVYPAINGYGRIVPLHNALQQPRDNSRIVVDVTRGGEPEELNGAIEKVARFVNIYRGAGKQPATVRITIVLHGDATLTILKPAVYSKRFNTKGNPNLDCLNKLQEQGVEILVCG